MKFNFFKKPEEDPRTQAVAIYEKTASLTTDGHEAHSLRLRMGMLCRAHLDKTFVDGAKQAEAHDLACALAIQQGKAKPDLPQASLFQTVKATNGEVVVYLPKEFADEAFAIGMLYQRTELSAEQAIAAAQRLADRLSFDVLKLVSPFTALQFLRDELREQAEQEQGEDGQGDEPGPGSPHPSA